MILSLGIIGYPNSMKFFLIMFRNLKGLRNCDSAFFFP